MKTTIPFTYYIYHRPTNKHYYGVRHKKGCNPSELWKTYFTSSKIVKKLIQEYGIDSFDYEVRKTFVDGKSALLWEQRVLTKLKAAQKVNWINRHNGSKNFFCSGHTQETKNKIGQSVRGIKRTKQTRDKMIKSSLIRERNKRENGFKMPVDFAERMVKTRKERIQSGLINPYSEERNRKMANSKKGTKRHYLPDGTFIMVKV
jgi:hypothetical protein